MFIHTFLLYTCGVERVKYVHVFNTDSKVICMKKY